MTDPLPPCEVDKRGRHDLMAFFHGDNFDIPATLVCTHCGISKQVPLTWSGEGTLDTLSAEEITRRLRTLD